MGFSLLYSKRGRADFLATVHSCAYIMIDFEWDRKKATGNLAKHGVDFADATGVLFDDLAITITDVHEEEERFVTIGTDSLSRVLVVAHTWREDRIRIISARRANRFERKQYEDSP